MAEPYIGEIRLFGGTFAPIGWAFCDGSLLPISGNDALFNLLGTTYGGDGQSTFGLPNLSGRMPLHQGAGFVIGQLAGSESVTLTGNQLPTHSHALTASSGSGNQKSPANGIPAASATGDFTYAQASPTVSMSPNAIAVAGGNQPHDNMSPYVAISFIIALEGIYPSQS